MGSRWLPVAPGSSRHSAGDSGRVYVRRRGRVTRAQSRALEHLSPQYLLPLPDRAIGQAFWTASFKRSATLAIEIGFGNGAALAKLAYTHPDWNCVGVDVYRPGFGALMLACERDGLENVRIVDTEALSLLQRLEPASVHLINVFFPDPWPKARHHKRRLVTGDFAAAVGACLKPRGALYFATDWTPYAEQMLAVFAAEPLLQGGETPRPATRPLTAFEAKGVAHGRRVVDLAYRRVAHSV